MRVLVVCNQRPLPTFHGANADIWRVVRALQTAGADVGCVTWRDSIADDAYLDEIRAAVPDYHEVPMQFPPSAGWWESTRVPDFARYRRLPGDRLDAAIEFARRFDPDCVLLIGLYGGELALQIASALGRPMLYRSHAIETQYHIEYFRLRRQAEGDHHWRRVERDRAQVRAISRFEQMIVAASALTLEVSADDLRARARDPQLRIEHLPPFVSTARTVVPARADWYDICYVGNLFMPNNQIGVRWFAKYVLPKVVALRGPQRVVIAGKSLDPGFVRELQGYAVDVIPNPADVDSIIAGSRVGVNPIFAGNGTTLKTIDYLWSGCPVVTSPIGLQGYRFGDPTVPAVVATSPDSFAQAIAVQLAHQHSIEWIRSKLDRFTWEVGGARLLDTMASVL
jgi:glycosyltransferase involved in cell wall biosynthesis